MILDRSTSRPTTPVHHICQVDSLESITLDQTPDDTYLAEEFEERLKRALEQSLVLQSQQMQYIDMLEEDIKV